MIKNIEQIIKVIDFWKRNAKEASLRDRTILTKIDLRSKEIIDLIGPRRSGKSSILKLIIKQLNLDEFLFINFEDPFFIDNNTPIIIEEIVDAYQEYYERELKFLFFDEIQVINQWERVIRKLRDAEKFKIFITGSSATLLGKDVSALLTGRHLSYYIFPLSFAEFLEFNEAGIRDRKDLILKENIIRKRFANYLQIGGFPEAVLTEKQELLKNYFFDIIQRDIVMRHAIREKTVLEKMALYTLTNSAKIISIESLKNIFNASFVLLVSYLEYLKDAFLIFELSQFSYSLKKQSKALKKIYAVDTGLANAVSFKFSEDKGRMLENVVFIELKRRQEEIYYYKTHNNREVDFMTREKNKSQQLIQVAWTLKDGKVKERELKALLESMKEQKLKEGLILTYDEEGETEIDKKRIIIKPTYKWLLEK